MNEIITNIFLGIIGIYALLMLSLALSFLLAILKTSGVTRGKVSVLIPFKNEAKHLAQLCKDLHALQYSRNDFEVIFLDDHSTDESVNIIKGEHPLFEYRILTLPKEMDGKKQAILLGVLHAKYDYLFTTDADCRLHQNLLSQIDTNKDLSIGITLKTTETNGLLGNFQELESLLLAGVTIGSAYMRLPSLASGANLGYKKSVFNALHPYDDNLHIASGDDMFLLKKAVDQHLKIDVRASPPALTDTPDSWKKYMNQVGRWAGKTGDIGLKSTSMIAVSVLLANVLLMSILILGHESWKIILPLKFVVDFLFLFLTATYYKRFKVLLFAPLVMILYPFYLMWLLLVIIQPGKSWKEDV